MTVYVLKQIQGFLKVNVDAAFPLGTDFFRISLVARNSAGKCVWWHRKEIQGRPQPFEGEAIAILNGVQTAIERNWSHVVVETDCLPVHRYLISNSPFLVSFGSALDACLGFGSSFVSLLFFFVRRSDNSLAHALVTANTLSCCEGLSIPSDLVV